MNIKVKYFLRASELTVFTNGAGNVASIVGITFDAASGQYVLFYT